MMHTASVLEMSSCYDGIKASVVFTVDRHKRMVYARCWVHWYHVDPDAGGTGWRLVDKSHETERRAWNDAATRAMGDAVGSFLASVKEDDRDGVKARAPMICITAASEAYDQAMSHGLVDWL